MKNIFCLIFISFLIASNTKAQSDSSGYHFRRFFADSAYSVITLDHDTIDSYEVLRQTRKTQSYHLTEYWEGEKQKTVLISEMSTQKFLSGAEGEEGRVLFSVRTS